VKSTLETSCRESLCISQSTSGTVMANQ